MEVVEGWGRVTLRDTHGWNHVTLLPTQQWNLGGIHVFGSA